MALSSPRQRSQPRPRLVAEQPLRHLLVFEDLRGILQQRQHEPVIVSKLLMSGGLRGSKESPAEARAGGKTFRMPPQASPAPALLKHRAVSAGSALARRPAWAAYRSPALPTPVRSDTLMRVVSVTWRCRSQQVRQGWQLYNGQYELG